MIQLLIAFVSLLQDHHPHNSHHPVSSSTPYSSHRHHVTQAPPSSSLPHPLSLTHTSNGGPPAAAIDSQQDSIAHDLSLQEELTELRQERDDLCSELADLRKNHAASLELSKQAMMGHYANEISSLQQSLLETESSLQVREKELMEAQDAHSVEMKDLLHQEQVTREALLSERDKKHAAHIARLTAQLSSQETVAGVVAQEEEERIQLLKEKMRVLHEQEKEQLLLAHQEEKNLLVKELEKENARQVKQLSAEYQQAMETNRISLEEMANKQIKQLHGQYVAAYEQAVAERDGLTGELASSKEQLVELQALAEGLREEKRDAERLVTQLRESHSEEVRVIRQTSQDLETRLQSWKSKAANLEARFQQSSDDDTNRQKAMIDTEERVKELRQQYESLLNVKQMNLEELEQRLQQRNDEHDRSIEKLKQRHQSAIEAMESQHADTVSHLEQNIAEQIASNKLLRHEADRVTHLQSELESYRDQETGDKAHLASLEQQHQEQLAALREELQHNIHDHQAALVRQQEEVTQAMMKEIEAQKQQLEAEHSRIIEQLKKEHQSNLDDLESHHTSEVSLLEESINQQEGSKASLEFAEAHMKDLQQQLNAYRNQDAHHQAERLAFEQERQEISAKLERVTQLYGSDKKQFASESEANIQKISELQNQLNIQQKQFEQEKVKPSGRPGSWS